MTDNNLEEAGPAADDSSDEDVIMATECQRIESPRPVRRAGDDNRCEMKVWYYDSITLTESICLSVCLSRIGF